MLLLSPIGLIVALIGLAFDTLGNPIAGNAREALASREYAGEAIAPIRDGNHVLLIAALTFVFYAVLIVAVAWISGRLARKPRLKSSRSPSGAN